MPADLYDISAFLAVAQAGGFRDAARASGASASSLSEAVRRLESKLGVRLLNRTTRSIAPTEAGARLLERMGPALAEVEAALEQALSEAQPRPEDVEKHTYAPSAVDAVYPGDYTGLPASEASGGR